MKNYTREPARSLFDATWRDDETEAAAEEFVLQITTAEDVGESARDELAVDERSGVFVLDAAEPAEEDDEPFDERY